MEEKKIRVKQTTWFSDGSEFTEEFGVNSNADVIEKKVAEDTAGRNTEEVKVETEGVAEEEREESAEEEA